MVNLMSGTKLAIFQDQCLSAIRGGYTITSDKLNLLTGNLWCKFASFFAPSNLVIRQACIIDLTLGRPYHAEKLIDWINKLSYSPGPEVGPRIWAEGYSYWEYTIEALSLWLDRFDGSVWEKEITSLYNKIDKGFVLTSYLRDGRWYPAPFGDVRDEPLSLRLDTRHEMKPVSIQTKYFKLNFDVMDRVRYEIIAKPVGLNAHVPCDNYQLSISPNGIPAGFKFYEGFDKKYKSTLDIWKDTLRLKRILHVW